MKLAETPMDVLSTFFGFSHHHVDVSKGYEGTEGGDRGGEGREKDIIDHTKTSLRENVNFNFF